MKNKKLLIISCVLLLIIATAYFFVFNLKTDSVKSETELLIELKEKTNTKSISKEKYVKEVFPLVESLHKIDTVKYAMINHIAKKTAAERVPEIYNNNYSDLKGEIELISIPKVSQH